MIDGPERRRFRRHPIQLPFAHSVVTSVSALAGAGWTYALSEGGASVEVEERFLLQMPLALRIRTEHGRIEVDARVAWAGSATLAKSPLRYGLAFTQVAPANLRTIREILPTRVQARKAGIRLPFEVPVTCLSLTSAAVSVQGRTGNANRGGLLLCLPRLMPPGTRLAVTMHAPSGPLTMEGAVAWVEPLEIWRPGESIGHGFEFTTADWSALRVLGLLLVELA
jgi:hypothetical protein